MSGRAEPRMSGRAEPRMSGRAEPRMSGRAEPRMSGRAELFVIHFFTCPGLLRGFFFFYHASV